MERKAVAGETSCKSKGLTIAVRLNVLFVYWMQADSHDLDSLLMFAIPIAIQDADHGGYRTKTDA